MGPNDPVELPGPADPIIVDLLARSTFPSAGTEVVCGVSGGADSTALLALALAAGLEVTAVHVDHGLRPESSREAATVERLARLWGAGFRSVVAPVGSGANLEERARVVRHDVLGPDALLGHTADDQAETVLLRLMRGTGPAGLAAMRPERHPILGLRRAETTALCRHLGVAPVEDPSNCDPRFVRNRVRHEVVPLLDDVAGRDVVPLLARLASLAAEQADLVADLAGRVDPGDAAAVRDAPVPVASEALRQWWRSESGSDHPPDAATLERMLAVATGGTVGCDVLDGWSMRRRHGRLRLVPPQSATSRRGRGPGEVGGRRSAGGS